MLAKKTRGRLWKVIGLSLVEIDWRSLLARKTKKCGCPVMLFVSVNE